MDRDEGIYMSKQGQFFYSTVSDLLNNKLCRKDAAERQKNLRRASR